VAFGREGRVEDDRTGGKEVGGGEWRVATGMADAPLHARAPTERRSNTTPTLDWRHGNGITGSESVGRATFRDLTAGAIAVQHNLTSVGGIIRQRTRLPTTIVSRGRWDRFRSAEASVEKTG